MTYMGILIFPLFPLNMQVKIKLVYVIQRPTYHFVSNDRACGIVKTELSIQNIRGHNRQGYFDNYIKFTLDAISRRLVLVNDKQAVRIEATKRFESTNEGVMTFA